VYIYIYIYIYITNLNVFKTLAKAQINTNSPVDLTQWLPVGDESVSELRPAAVVLQQSDEAGGGAGRLAKLAQLRHARAVLPESGRRPVGRGRRR